MAQDQRFVGVDVGTRRVGVAVSDDSGSFAVPYATYDASEAPEAIVEVAQEIGAATLVVGWPLELNGREGRAVRRVEAFLEKIEHAAEKAKVSLEVETWDERLTTTSAEALLIDADMSRRRRKKVVDQVAATHILQGFLDSLRIRREREAEDDGS